MAATMKKTVAVEDVNVTFEDQKKINTFARNTNRMTEFKDEIEAKKKSLQNLQDASDDLMMAEDDTLHVPYQIGDVFISHTQEETQEMLEAAKVCFHLVAGMSMKGVDYLVTAVKKLFQGLTGESVVDCSFAALSYKHMVEEQLEQEIKELEGKVSAIQRVLGDLKVQLYAKFGNNINLEADES